MSRNAVFISTMTLIVVLVLLVLGVAAWKVLVFAPLVALVFYMTNLRDRAYRRQVGLQGEEDQD
ncbi:hypothetical protein [Sphingomonas sp. KR3-1]|uniref:hypothetical protein n=1 Tax=Sphingomonas sp. KR3-1 TaxID=3156611 RepID=UPI0032B320DD